MEEFTIEMDFKGTAAGRDHLDRVEAGSFTNFGCQTGSTRFVVSDRAVFDRDVVFHP